VAEKEEEGRGRRRVLVVDDDPDILSIVTTLLTSQGYQVFQAGRSQDFFTVMGRERPQVALVDFMLPGMNGLEIIKLARRIDENLQLIAVTGQGDERLAAEIMRSGAVDYISKPFANREVLGAVERAMDLWRIRTSLPYRDLADANRDLLRRMNEREAILKNMTDALISVDTNLRILSWNGAAESFTGASEKEVLGRSMKEIFGAPFCRLEERLLGHPEEESYVNVEESLEIVGRKSAPLTVLKSAAFLRDERGMITGLVVSIKDISDRKILLNECIEKELELERAREEIIRREELRRKNELLLKGMEELSRKVSELSTLNEAGKILSSKLDLGDVLNTVMTMAGDLFQAQAYSIRLMKEDEGILSIVAHSGLSEEYLKKGPISVGDSVAGAVAQQRKPIHVPDALSHHGLYKADVAAREGLKSIYCLPLVIRDRCIGVMTFYHKKPHSYGDDQTQFLSTFASTVSIAIDNARLYEEQKRQAVTDGLTGLYNHKFFHDNLARELNRAQRYGNRLSVIILDIDLFKKYNDAYGHQEGDALLREMGGILKKVARENDLVARYGGEEFVFLLHQVSKSEAMLFARRLRKRICDHGFKGEDILPGGRLTISLGLACFPEDADSVASLIHTADQALYRAKREGRNRVRAFQTVG
jgi:diguanylate cyclase (GGDEF)-like protein/PAS domain S-box-containing protein